MTDSKALIEQATRRAAILHASAAWGSDEDGALIDRLLARIVELEADNARLRERLAKYDELKAGIVGSRAALQETSHDA